MKKPLLGVLNSATFISNQQLAADSIALANKLSEYEFKGVIGIPRSGLIPAAQIAAHLHLPLYSIKNGLIQLNAGQRLQEPAKGKKFLMVDDTYCNGTAAKRALEQSGLDRSDVYLCAVYCHTLEGLDFGGYLYSLPHFLEWCFCNTFYSKWMVFDFDGIICEDWKEKPVSDTDPLWTKHIRTVKPLYLPRKFPATIITARPNIFSTISLIWLQKHGVKVDKIYFWEKNPEERWKDEFTVASWKADILRILRKQQHINFYVESDIKQAIYIMQFSGIPVICPAAKTVFGWSDEFFPYVRWS